MILKNKKAVIIGLAGLLAMSGVAATVVACSTDPGNVLTVQTEAAWVEIYQEAIDEFKANNAALMEANGVDDIVVVERGSFDHLDTQSTNGNTDDAISDLYVAPGDRMLELNGNGFLKPYTEDTLAAFEAKYMDDTFIQGAKESAIIMDDRLFAIPDRIEGLLPYSIDGEPKTNIITKYSDLWFSNGFFNRFGDSDLNLKYIVELIDGAVINNANSASTNSADWVTFLNNGFGNIYDMAGDALDNVDTLGNDRSSEVVASELLAADGGTSEPALFSLFNNNKDDTSIIAGVWQKTAIQDLLTPIADITATEIASTQHYIQWQGGWGYVLNARITDEEQTVLESLIPSIIDSKRSLSFAAEGIDKFSPTTKGINLLIGDPISEDGALDAGLEKTLELIYSGEYATRPLEAVFGSIWSAWSETIEANANAFVDNIVNRDRSGFIDTLTAAFIEAVDAKIAI